jgi:hypothetical protein
MWGRKLAGQLWVITGIAESGLMKPRRIESGIIGPR